MNQPRGEGRDFRLRFVRGKWGRPNLRNPFARDTRAQVWVALPGKALFGPLDAEAVVAGTFRTSGDRYPIREIAAKHEVDQGWRRHGNARQHHRSLEPSGRCAVLASQHEHATGPGELARSLNDLLAQLLQRELG